MYLKIIIQATYSFYSYVYMPVYIYVDTVQFYSLNMLRVTLNLFTWLI